MLMKRIMAKIIDNLLFSMIVIAISILLVIIINRTVQVESFDQVAIIYDQITIAGDDTAMIESIIDDNIQFLVNFAYNYALYFFAMTILIGFIYFGLLGVRLKGSIGKKILKLRVVTNDGNAPNIMTLVMREPLVQIAFFSLVFTMLSPVIPLFILIPNLMNIIYMIFFLMHRDFWNTKFKLRVVYELD